MWKDFDMVPVKMYRWRTSPLSKFLVVLVVGLVNVRSVLTRSRWKRVKPVLKQVQEDIICLQECRLPGETDYRRFERRWRWGPSWWLRANDNKTTGIAILSKNPELKVKQVEKICGRMQRGGGQGQKMEILNVYASLMYKQCV